MNSTDRQGGAGTATSAAPYEEKGIEAARKLVRTAAGVDAAALFAFVVRVLRNDHGKEAFDLAAFDACGFPRSDLKYRLRRAAAAFSRAFSLSLLDGLDEECGDQDQATGSAGIRIASDFVAFLERDCWFLAGATAILDSEATTWASIAVAAARSQGGHHLALRCADDDRRIVQDFAALVAAADVGIFYLHGREPLGAALLAAELFGDDDMVIVADGSYLVEAETAADPEFETPKDSGALSANPVLLGLMPLLASLRRTHVWRIPHRGSLPQELRQLVGAEFGPLRQDPGWRAAHVKGLAPGIDGNAMQVLLARVDDARDAGAMARLSIAAAAAGVAGAATVSDACLLIGGSGDGQRSMTEATDVAFDEALLACDPEALELLARGHALAEGGRVLAYGPPGGGKSAFAKVLAGRIAAAAGGAAPTVVTPATLLMKAWGGTERQLAALWQRAHRTASVLVADEFDSMAGVREADAPASGNAHLIRTLTNEWLRQMDSYRGVPLIVTVNDLDALDPAIRRRFPLVFEFRDELRAEQEHRAWDTIIEMAPPPGWSPIGACVADFVSARERCRIVGRDDAASHAAALVEARAVRLGRQPPRSRSKRKAPVH